MDKSDLFSKNKQKFEICAGTKCGGAMATGGKTQGTNHCKDSRSPGCGRGDADPWKNVNPSDRVRWESENKEVAKEAAILKNQNEKMHSVALGQCMDAMMARIESHTDCGAASVKRSAVGMLKTIQSMCLDVQEQKCCAQTIYQQKRQLHKMEQGPNGTAS